MRRCKKSSSSSANLGTTPQPQCQASPTHKRPSRRAPWSCSRAACARKKRPTACAQCAARRFACGAGTGTARRFRRCATSASQWRPGWRAGTRVNVARRRAESAARAGKSCAMTAGFGSFRLCGAGVARGRISVASLATLYPKPKQNSTISLIYFGILGKTCPVLHEIKD